MELRLVGRDGVLTPLHDDQIQPEERLELDALAEDADVIGLHVLSRDGTPVRSEGACRATAGPIFSNLLRLAARLGEEIGEAPRNVMIFADNDEIEISALALSKTDAAVIRRGERRRGLRHVG